MTGGGARGKRHREVGENEKKTFIFFTCQSGFHFIKWTCEKLCFNHFKMQKKEKKRNPFKTEVQREKKERLNPWETFWADGAEKKKVYISLPNLNLFLIQDKTALEKRKGRENHIYKLLGVAFHMFLKQSGIADLPKAGEFVPSPEFLNRQVQEPFSSCVWCSALWQFCRCSWDI